MIVSSLITAVDRFLAFAFAMGVILSNMTDSRLAVDLSDGAGELANKDADTLAEMFRLVVDLLIDLSSGRMDGLLSMMNRSASPMVENFL